MLFTMTSTKKARELMHIEAFRTACVGFPEGDLTAGEEPDFLVGVAEGPLGIEVTQFFKDGGEDGGSKEKAQESYQDEALGRAIQEHRMKGRPPVVVSIFGASFDDMVRRRVDALAHEIADAVAAHLPLGPGAVEVEQAGLPGSPLPDELSRLHIYRIENWHEDEWRWVRAGYRPQVEAGQIQRIIEGKERRLSYYRRRAGRLWLLIVAEGLAPSSFADVDRLRNEQFASSFDDVFFFRLFDKHVLRLTLMHATTPAHPW